MEQKIESEERFRLKIGEMKGVIIGRYVNAAVPIECKCQFGHICRPRPYSVMQGFGMCTKCRFVKYQTEGEANFRKKIEELGGVILGKFINGHTPIECVCRFLHKCKPTPNNIHQERGMCIICAGIDPVTAENTFRKLVSEMKGVVVGSYINGDTRIECICGNGHVCHPLPCSVNSGRSICRRCTKSRGEKKLEQLLTKLGVKFEAQYQFTKSNRCLYDFGNENTVIEFDGRQHFSADDFFDRHYSFAERRAKDIAKTILAIEHGRKIIRIHFSWLKLEEEAQIQFLKSALAKNAPVIVNDLEAYSWLPMPIVLP
jgi:very-short-patch-repair endonuclease